MKNIVDLDQSQIEMKKNGEIVGLYILENEESVKSNIEFVHKLAQLNTRVTLRFILFDKSKLDLEATVRIDRGAANTDTYLKIDVLLMSEEANAHVVPSMEIQEDDVKGGHGATIGMLDEKQIWYLMSRGMSQQVAERTLVSGFVNSMLEKIDDNDLRKNLMNKINNRI